MEFLKIIIVIVATCYLPSFVFSAPPLLPQTPKLRSKADGKGKLFYALDFLGLANLHGYQAEWYNVTTEDGYIIAIHRLLPNKQRHMEKKRPVVFLQHGLMATSDAFVAYGPERGLAFVLVDAGYDVWAGNFRGNTYCRQNTRLSTSDRQFWNFSLDEYGIYDLPPQIDFILDFTNKPTLSFIGHSLGATAHIMLLSEHPEYNKKMDLVVYFAPVVYSITRTTLRNILPAIALIPQLFRPYGAVEAFSQTLFSPVMIYFCASSRTLLELCQLGMDNLVGYDREQFDLMEFPGVMLYYPAGTSLKVIYHYGQQTLTGKFRKYDYLSRKLNIKHYNNPLPPEYDIRNIDVPKIIILRGPGDVVTTDEDMKYFIKKLSPNQSIVYENVNFPKFNHGEFISARDIKTLVNEPVRDYLNEYYRDKRK